MSPTGHVKEKYNYMIDAEMRQATAQQKKPRSAFSKMMSVVSNVLFYAVLVAVVVGSTLFAFSKDPGKSYFGYQFYNVLSNSMVPNTAAKEAGLAGGFKKGDLIFIKITDPKEIAVGDIITFTPDTEGTAYLTHRVVEVKTSLNNTKGLFFVTRGDANNTDDPTISAEMVIGKKVAVVPYAGMIIEFIKKNFIPVVIFIVGGFGVIILLRILLSKPKEVKSDAGEQHKAMYIGNEWYMSHFPAVDRSNKRF